MKKINHGMPQATSLPPCDALHQKSCLDLITRTHTGAPRRAPVVDHTDQRFLFSRVRFWQETILTWLNCSTVGLLLFHILNKVWWDVKNKSKSWENKTSGKARKNKRYLKNSWDELRQAASSVYKHRGFIISCYTANQVVFNAKMHVQTLYAFCCLN